MIGSTSCVLLSICTSIHASIHPLFELTPLLEWIPQEVFDDLALLTGIRPEFDHLPAVTWLEAAAEIVDSIRGDRGWEYRHCRRSVMWMALDEHGVF